MDSCEVFSKGIPKIKALQTRTLGLASNGRFKRQDPSIDGAWLRQSNSMRRIPSNPAFNSYSLWNEFVEAYSRMKLTHQSDKLVAISGIAKDMREILNDQYVAGLWLNHLPFHLLWTKHRDIPMNTEPIDYIAPTWSWASINEKVTMYPITSSSNERILIDVAAVETFPITTDDTGQLGGGYIRMRVFLRKCWLARYQILNRIPQVRASPTRLWLDMQKEPSSIYVWPDEVDNIYPHNSMDDISCGVYCIPIHMWWNEDKDCCTEGLILKKVSQGVSKKYYEDVYKRFGRFKITLANTQDTLTFFGKTPEELVRGFTNGDQVPLTGATICLV